MLYRDHIGMILFSTKNQLDSKGSSNLTHSAPALGVQIQYSYALPNHMLVSLNYCSQNGGNLYRAPYYNGNPNIGPRIIGNLDQSSYTGTSVVILCWDPHKAMLHSEKLLLHVCEADQAKAVVSRVSPAEGIQRALRWSTPLRLVR